MTPPIPWQVFSDGWTSAREAVAIQGGSWSREIRFHATAFLLQHPGLGPILVDSGYSHRFASETAALPNAIYRWITPVTLTQPDGIAACLEKAGLASHEIKHVVITHFHADHAGGLRDFPNARVHCTRAAWSAVRGLQGLAAVRKGILPGLLPNDLASRLGFLDEDSPLASGQGLEFPEFPGHANGQCGVAFTGADGREILLASDACWLSRAYRENRMPHPVTRLLHDWPAYRDSLDRLHRAHRENPDLLILPSHCPETAAYLQ